MGTSVIGPPTAISLLTLEELRQIQLDIRNTLRPSWHEGPPSNLGEKGHGKLKSDQWRSCIEFDLPVSLVSLLQKAQQQKRSSDISRLRQVLDSTMLLATAIQWATSHRTSTLHVERYTSLMGQYLQSIRKLRPDLDLHPNHHNALHIQEFLLSFGPMHGWWMYPFERVNGILQSTPSNFKIGTPFLIVLISAGLAYSSRSVGQLEKTMLESFCAASQIKSFADRLDSPILHKCATMLQTCIAVDNRGTLNADVNQFLPFHGLTTSADPLVTPLDAELVAALQRDSAAFERELPGWAISKYGTIHSNFKLRRFTFSKSSVNLRNSIIFYQSDHCGNLQPGIIREIFTIHSQDGLSHWTFLAVHPYLSHTHLIDNQLFTQWTDFGASLYSTEHDPYIHIVPTSRRIFHAIQRRWNGTSQVLKSLDRVSTFYPLPVPWPLPLFL